MKRTALAALTVATVALAIAVPAEAQTHRGAFGVYGGAMWFSALNRGGPAQIEILNLNNKITLIDVERVGLRTSWVVGAQLEQFFGDGRIGLRANAGYSGPTMQLTDGPRLDIGTMNVWLGDIDLMVRLLRPDIQRAVAPFIALGLGAVHYNAPGDGDIILPTANAEFRGNTETQFAGVAGIGTDFFFADPFMLRLEVADHIAFRSPLRRLDDGSRFNEVHNVRLTAGLHVLWDRVTPPPVAVVPPPPPPPPAPPPPPPPPPAEETVLVCVIDPTAPGGIRLVEAIRVIDTGEHFVIRNGQRVRLEDAVTRVPVAREADWFVAGRPMALEYAGVRTEFVTFGAPRVIEPEDLVFLGTVNGLAVYAPRGVDPVLAAQPGQDLRTRLHTQADVRRAFQNVDVLYVPADVIGCVFVPLERVEVVRKIRG